MKYQLLVLALVAVSASAWAKAPSQELLQERAAFALGASTEQVVIGNVRKSGGMASRYDFTATVKGVTSRCYVTNSLGNSSDALCSTPGKGASCDALSQAAGRCR